MRRSGIPIEWYSYESEMARDWLESLDFASEREKVAHLRRIGEIVAAMHGGKIPKKFSTAENSLVELGNAFISGELRVSTSRVPGNEEDSAFEWWRDSLGMSKAAFQRHMTGIGTMVYEVLSLKPISVETFFTTLTQVAERLLVRRAKDPMELAGAFREWQKKERQTKKGRDPRQVLSRRRDI